MITLDVHGLEPLLHRVRAGDGRAFNELLAGLRRYMQARVRQQLGASADGRIDQSALVQSTCRRVIKNFGVLEGPAVPPLLAWIKAIVKNRVNDELRKLARHPTVALGSQAVLVEDRPPPADPDQAQVAATVAAALATLPARQRRAVEGRWFDRQPDEATAAELGITVNHVRQLRFQALKKLRPLLRHLEGSLDDR